MEFRLRSGARKISVLVAGLLSFMVMAAPAFSVGSFMDASRVSAFIRTPARPGLTGSITRADSQDENASLFDLAWFFPVRSSFLVELETSYISLAVGDDVVEGFGDSFLWLRARAWTGHRKALFLTSRTRFGTGSAVYFPFSTASIDVGAGVAFVDSLGYGDERPASGPSTGLSCWITVEGTYVMRLDDVLEKSELHGDHLTAGGGVLATFARGFEIELGGLGIVFGSGAAREILFSQVTLVLSPAADIHVTVQKEVGDSSERAVDASAAVGLTVRY